MLIIDLRIDSRIAVRRADGFPHGAKRSAHPVVVSETTSCNGVAEHHAFERLAPTQSHIHLSVTMG